MERLEIKTIKGRKYYYHSKWGRVQGKPRRLWQRYIGTLDDLLQKCSGTQEAGHAELSEWGLSTALNMESTKAEIKESVDSVVEKWKRTANKTRAQGLSTGTYIAIAAINRASDSPCSKRSMWQWFSKTAMLRHFPEVKEDLLSSQNFWNHMELLSPAKCKRIWKVIVEKVLKRENIDLSSVSYDGTNFYTFIDTFNSRCSLAKRGKNKQGRNNLRQISYALFCSADSHVPLHYEIFEGNQNDITNFPKALTGFKAFFNNRIPPEILQKMTVVFDKGNNSPDNFKAIDDDGIYFVGSVKLGEHKELAEIPNDSPLFRLCSEEFDGVKVHRVKKKVYGKERDVLVTYSPDLHTAQFLTVENDIKQAIEALSSIKERLKIRSESLLPIAGKQPTKESIQKQCQACLQRPYMEKIIVVIITEDGRKNLLIDYSIDVDALTTVANTYLGKNILITNRSEWGDEKVVRAYRSQYIIEDVFKEMKDRKMGEWWPMYHWTDTKIHVHALYCTIAVLLRAMVMKRVRDAGHSWSLKKIFDELSQINEVVNIYKPTGQGRKPHVQKLLTSTSEIQEALLTALDMSSAAFADG